MEGDQVYAIGYPDTSPGARVTTQGIYSGSSNDGELTWILSDVDISNGNSGGPLLNAESRLVGIPTKRRTGVTSGEVLGYSRPIEAAEPLIAEAHNILAGAGSANATSDIFCTEDFTSSNGIWPLGYNETDSTEREYRIAEGKLHGSVRFKRNVYTWINAPDCEVKHFYLHVDVTARQATDTDTGIVLLLRNQKRQDGNDHYRVVFYLDRSFEIDVSHEGEREPLQERTTTRQLTLADGETHRLGVLLVGGQLTVFVNGEKIATTFDETLTSAGGIGLGLMGNADEEITVAFDNFVVKKHTAPGVLFYDFFDDNHNEWKLSHINNADVDCEDQIVEGRLEHRLTVKTRANVCYSTAPALTAEDFWLQIDTIWLDRRVEGSWLEIAFRRDEETGHRYYLRLSQSGSYFLGKYDQGEWHTLQAWTRSAAIQRGRRQSNTVQLWVRGPYITLAVNGTELITVEDDQPLTAGQILPGIGGDTGVDTVVAFDNLIVRETPPPTE
jgi:hypothetical protein